MAASVVITGSVEQVARDISIPFVSYRATLAARHPEFITDTILAEDRRFLLAIAADGEVPNRNGDVFAGGINREALQRALHDLPTFQVPEPILLPERLLEEIRAWGAEDPPEEEQRAVLRNGWTGPTQRQRMRLSVRDWMRFITAPHTCRQEQERLTTRTLNEHLFDQLNTPSDNRAAIDAVNEFTYSRMREEGFYRRIMPPMQISNDELDRVMNSGQLDRELVADPDRDRATETNRPVREIDAEERSRELTQALANLPRADIEASNNIGSVPMGIAGDDPRIHVETCEMLRGLRERYSPEVQMGRKVRATVRRLLEQFNWGRMITRWQLHCCLESWDPQEQQSDDSNR